MGQDTDLPGFSYEPQGHGDVPKKQTKSKKSGGFQSMGLTFPVLKGIARRGYNIPTPIQRRTIPLLIEGRDVVAMAKTGSGKTACFLIPLFEKLKQRQAKSGARALILSPTRELAVQTFKFIKELGKFMDLKTVLILGGDSMDAQFSAIHTSPDIVVATPGRFLHLCVEMDLKLHSIEYVVFDEADRLFEMGFGEQLSETLRRLPDSRQMVMFSATLPKLMVDFAKAGLSDPVLIRLDVESKIPETLKLKFIHCRPEERFSTLLVLLKTVIPAQAQTVVFAGTQYHVELLSHILDKAGISNTYIYSTLDPSARKINTAKFAQNKVSVLIVTDVAARGIDIPNLDFVINFHFPGKAKLFVHRVGRCARAGREGTAFSIFSTDDQAHLLDLHLFLSKPFNIYDTNSIGTIPADLQEEEHHAVIDWLKDVNIAGIYKTSNNAYKHYLSTRPSASADSNKRIKTIQFFKLRTLDEFNAICDGPATPKKNDEDVKENFARILKEDLLIKMKKYRPAGTVFELNPHKQSVPNEIMKQKRVTHQRVIEKFNEKLSACEKLELEDKEKEESELVVNKVALPEPSAEDIASAFSRVFESRKRANLDDLYKEKPKRQKHVMAKDTENYIPYYAKDRHTEDGLAITSFSKDIQSAEISVTADNQEGIQISRKLKKWDRVRKKMVSVQDPHQGKIRTESGLWIPATYKTGRYSDWKQKTKIDDQVTHDDDEQEAPQSKAPRREAHTHWARHNLKMEMKQRQGVDKELKRPEQIAKERLRLDKIKQTQANNHQKRQHNRKMHNRNVKRKGNSSRK